MKPQVISSALGSGLGSLAGSLVGDAQRAEAARQAQQAQQSAILWSKSHTPHSPYVKTQTPACSKALIAIVPGSETGMALLTFPPDEENTPMQVNGFSGGCVHILEHLRDVGNAYGDVRIIIEDKSQDPSITLDSPENRHILKQIGWWNYVFESGELNKRPHVNFDYRYVSPKSWRKTVDAPEVPLPELENGEFYDRSRVRYGHYSEGVMPIGSGTAFGLVEALERELVAEKLANV